MAEQVLELIARISPEGAEETTQALDDAEESFENTADTIEDESQRLERFSERFKGALAVATTGLAIASAGLLSNIPALQESFTALSGLVERTGLSISDTFSPALNELTQALLDTGNESDETSEKTRRLRDIFLGVGSAAVGAAAGVGFLVSPLVGVATLAFGLAFAVGLVSTELTGLTNATKLSEEEFTGFKGAAQDLALLLSGPLVFGLAVAAGFIEDGIPGAVTAGVEALKVLGDAFFDLTVFAIGEIAKLATVGLAIFDRFFSDVVRFAKKSFNSLLDVIEDTINDIASAAETLPGVGNIGRVSFDRFDVTERGTSNQRARQRAISRRASIVAGVQRGQEGNVVDRLADILERLENERSGDTNIQIDGRTVAKETGKRLGGGTATRGR